MENFEDEPVLKKEIKNIPWDEREKIGFFNSLYLTMKEALFKPAEFFGKINNSNIKNSILYALIIASFFYSLNLLWIGQKIDFRYPIYLPFISLVFFFLLELGLIHLGLLLFSSNKAGFATTFKVMAYSESALVFSAIPIMGGIVSSIWGGVLTIIGLSKAHNITMKKALFSTIFSIIACLIIIFLLGFLFK